MPISFQQPQPLDTNLAANYGAQGARQAAAASNSHAAAVQQEAADNASQRALQATLAGERLAGDMSQQNAQREWQGNQNSANRATDRAMLGDRLTAESGQIYQRAQAQMEVNNAELSQAAKVHYQRLKQAVSVIDQQVADGTLSEEHGNDMKLQVYTGLSKYQSQDAHAKALLQQQQLKDVHEQRAAAIALETMDDEQRAVAMKKRIWTADDGVQYYRDNGGNIKMLEKPKAEKAAEYKPYPRESVANILRDSEAYAAAKMGGRKRADFVNDPGGVAEFERHLTEKWDALHVEEDRKQRLWEQAHGSHPGQVAGSQNLGNPNSAPPSNVNPDRPTGFQGGGPKPFDINKPEAMTPPQKEAHRQYVETNKTIDQLAVPEFERGPLRAASRQMTELIGGAGGDPKNFTPEQQKQYDELFASMTNMAAVAAAKSQQNLQNRMKPGELAGAGQPQATLGGSAEVVGNLGKFGSKEALQKATDEQQAKARVARAEIAKRDAEALAERARKEEIAAKSGLKFNK